MPRYQVLWEIDVEADSPAAAAQEAFAAMQAADTTATCFTVIATDTGKRFAVELRPHEGDPVVRPEENPPTPKDL